MKIEIALAGGAGTSSAAHGPQRALRRRLQPTSAWCCRAASTTAPCRALQQLGLADAFGEQPHPAAGAQRGVPAGARRAGGLLRRQARGAAGRGRPAQLHRGCAARDPAARRQRHQTPLHGKDIFPMAGEYTGEVLVRALAEFVRRSAPEALAAEGVARVGAAAAPLAGNSTAAPRSKPLEHAAARTGRRASASAAPSGRCSRRIKLTQKDMGAIHVSGRHRLPHLRHLASPSTMGQHGAGLRHRAWRAARACRAADGAARARQHHGRRRLLAQRPAHQRRAERALQRRTTRCC